MGQATLHPELPPRRVGHRLGLVLYDRRLVSGGADRLDVLASVASADVEVHDRTRLIERVPHGLEVGLGQLGQAEELRLVRQCEPADALVDQPCHLLDGELHVPDRKHRLGDEPPTGLLLDVDVEVVEEAHDLQPHLVVLDGEDVVGREADGIGIHDLGGDAEVVHQCQSLRHRPGSRVQGVERLDDVLAEHFLSTSADRVAPDAGPRFAVDVPPGAAVERLLDRHPPAHGGGCP